MLAAQISAFGLPEKVIELIEQPDPGEPGPGEVLVTTELVPINPADLANLQGLYGASRPKLPLTPGSEGVGRIAKVGAGVSHVKPGDRVIPPVSGTWRSQVKGPAKAVFALPEDVDAKQLAMLRVNPPTAYQMLHDIVPLKAGEWVIQNAANSGVGHCLIRLARKAGVKTVNVVRREELVAPLRAYGADVVLLDGPDLDKRVRAAIGEGVLKLAIDAIGGPATTRIARCVADSGTVVNYGLLSGEPSAVEARELIFRDVTLRGFWLPRWFMKSTPEQVAARYRELAGYLRDGTLAVEVEAVYPVREIRKALAHAGRGGRSGKVLLDFAGA